MDVVGDARLGAFAQDEAARPRHDDAALHPVPHELHREERTAARALGDFLRERALEAEQLAHEARMRVGVERREAELVSLLSAQERLDPLRDVGAALEILLARGDHDEHRQRVRGARQALEERERIEPEHEVVEDEHDRLASTDAAQEAAQRRVTIARARETLVPTLHDRGEILGVCAIAAEPAALLQPHGEVRRQRVALEPARAEVAREHRAEAIGRASLRAVRRDQSDGRTELDRGLDQPLREACLAVPRGSTHQHELRGAALVHAHEL